MLHQLTAAKLPPSVFLLTLLLVLSKAVSLNLFFQLNIILPEYSALSVYFLSFLSIPCTPWYTVLSGSKWDSPFRFTQAVPTASAMQHHYFCRIPSLDFVLGNLNCTKIQSLIPHQPLVVCSNICFAFCPHSPTLSSMPCKLYTSRSIYTYPIIQNNH